MKTIGLLSDTHGYLDNSMIAHLQPCNEIWHAGDVGSMDVLESLERLKPVRAVSGNVDDYQMRLKLPEIQRFLCETTDVLMVHIGGYPGKYARKIGEIIRIKPPRLFISGHSHILKVIYDKKYSLLHINPGASGKTGLHKVRTMVRFKIDSDQITDLEVIELGPHI